MHTKAAVYTPVNAIDVEKSLCNAAVPRRCGSQEEEMAQQDAPQPFQQRFRSLADVAFEAIEQMIVTRRLAPGAMLSESEIAAELSMGRTPVREALARLEWIGFVEVHPRRGVQVSNVDVMRHLELLEVRLPLEISTVRHAVERATPADCEELQFLTRELTEAAAKRDRDNYFRVKRTLHEVEVRAAYNHVLTQTMRSLHAQSRRFWFAYEPSESFAEAAERHRVVMEQNCKPKRRGGRRCGRGLVRLPSTDDKARPRAQTHSVIPRETPRGARAKPLSCAASSADACRSPDWRTTAKNAPENAADPAGADRRVGPGRRSRD